MHPLLRVLPRMTYDQQVELAIVLLRSAQEGYATDREKYADSNLIIDANLDRLILSSERSGILDSVITMLKHTWKD